MPAPKFLRIVLAPLFVLALSAGSGCSLEPTPRSALDKAREEAASGDPDALGRLLSAELVAPGGTTKGARDARKKLDAATGGGLDAKLARALDDDVHGVATKAFDEWIEVLVATAEAPSKRSPLVGLVAVEALSDLAPLVPRAHRLTALQGLAPLLAPRATPSGLGFRALSSIAHLVAAASEFGKPLSEGAAIRRKTIGCVEKMRIAGPFEFSPGDDDTSALEGEHATSWPAVFEGRPGASVRPRVLATESIGCTTSAKSSPGRGVYLAETFLTLDREQEIVLAPSDGTRVTVDDVVVRLRDRTKWGGPLHDSVVLRLAAGRHRIVVRAGDGASAIEVRAHDGETLKVTTDDDPTPAYGGKKPVVVDDPHPVLAASEDSEHDPLTTFFAARAALDRDAADVASVILGELLDAGTGPVKESDAPGALLELAAQAAVRDPIWPAPRATSRGKALFERAAEVDPELWLSPLLAVELQGEGTPPPEKAKRLAALVAKAKERPNASLQLVELYGELGWTLEHDKLVADLVKQFPDDPSVVRMQLTNLDEHGPLTAADKLAIHLAEIEPDEPILAQRFLGLGDVPGAIKAFEAFVAAHPDRKSYVTRLEELKASQGSIDEATARIAAELAKGKGTAMDFLEQGLAKGNKHAFDDAIKRTIEKYAVRPGDVLRALELLQQTLDFSPFRLDAHKVIAEHDEKHKGKTPQGSAERILDYGALWIRSDGSTSFLEHEIIRVLSRDAIGELSRVQAKAGKALHLRVLKKDGRSLEPLRVAGKPDLTFPDLDVGDIIETEVISSGSASMSSYVAPRWFFAEPRIAYARSEYLVITPKGRAAIFEARAGAPKPVVSELGAFDVRRFRADDAPPAPDEPEYRASGDEWIPNVSFGWGVKLEDAVASAAAALKETTPVDPRIVKKAMSIVGTIPPAKTAERARKLYQWVTRNIQKGEESDGRRVIIGNSGDPAAAFRVLARAAGIDTYIAIAHDRLAPPPASPLSAGDGFRHTLLDVSTDEGELFMSFGGRYLPFGYVPPSARGEEAIVLRPGAPRSKVPAGGVVDGIFVRGNFDMAPNGDAVGTLTLEYSGIIGASLREGIDQLSEGELRAAVESGILAKQLPNVQLKKLEIVNREDLDQPLGINVAVEVPSFARAVGGGELVVFAPFRRRLAGLVPHPLRLTPMVLDGGEKQTLQIDIRLPSGMKVKRGPIVGKLAFGPDLTEASDSLTGSTLTMKRAWDLAAARIDPDKYASFRTFCLASDALSEEETVIGN